MATQNPESLTSDAVRFDFHRRLAIFSQRKPLDIAPTTVVVPFAVIKQAFARINDMEVAAEMSGVPMPCITPEGGRK